VKEVSYVSLPYHAAMAAVSFVDEVAGIKVQGVYRAVTSMSVVDFEAVKWVYYSHDLVQRPEDSVSLRKAVNVYCLPVEAVDNPVVDP
jgi:hypothetical protein